MLNLLSEGIVNADGSPGPNFAKAHQFKIVSAPNGGKFFISAKLADKQLYDTLPAPDVAGVGSVSPYAAILSIPGGDPGLPPDDQFLFGTGGTGLGSRSDQTSASAMSTALPPGPFQRPDRRCRMTHSPATPSSVLPDGSAGRLRDR